MTYTTISTAILAITAWNVAAWAPECYLLMCAQRFSAVLRSASHGLKLCLVCVCDRQGAFCKGQGLLLHAEGTDIIPFSAKLCMLCHWLLDKRHAKAWHIHMQQSDDLQQS